VALTLILLIITDEAIADAEFRQQHCRSACILRRNIINLLEDLHCTRTYVLTIAERRRYEKQCTDLFSLFIVRSAICDLFHHDVISLKTHLFTNSHH
jgi:hypothetical protein